MKRLPLSLLAHWAGGELLGDDLVIGSLTHDTRALVPGSLYLALRGERFDGHDFAYDAAMRAQEAKDRHASAPPWRWWTVTTAWAIW